MCSFFCYGWLLRRTLGETLKKHKENVKKMEGERVRSGVRIDWTSIPVFGRAPHTGYRWCGDGVQGKAFGRIHSIPLPAGSLCHMLPFCVRFDRTFRYVSLFFSVGFWVFTLSLLPFRTLISPVDRCARGWQGRPNRQWVEKLDARKIKYPFPVRGHLLCCKHGVQRAAPVVHFSGKQLLFMVDMAVLEWSE